MQLSSMPSVFPSYYCIHFVMHSKVLFIANATVKQWMQNILDVCFICSLAVCEKVESKGRTTYNEVSTFSFYYPDFSSCCSNHAFQIRWVYFSDKKPANLHMQAPESFTCNISTF
jgi:hypothetical protein